MSNPDLPRAVTDPDGRTVEFTTLSWEHLLVERPQLLGNLDAILAAIASPDLREDDPRSGRERFYRRQVTDKVRWLRVVVDFSADPAYVVTAFIQRKDPAKQR